MDNKKTDNNGDEWRYFQFCREMDYPVYIRIDSSQFEEDTASFLNSMQFSEVPSSENREAERRILNEDYARVLTMTEASPIVAREIVMVSDSDRYGMESVLPKDGYRLYRYKGEAVIIFALTAREWTMGCFSEFGEKENLFAYRSVVSRFLSWSLAPLGVTGFWGVPVDDGMVIQRQDSSNAEAIFLDINKKKLITFEGIKKIRSKFTIFKLDHTLKARSIQMKREETLSFLSSYSTYFDYSGLTVAVRQMIQTIARDYNAETIPLENFKPRANLSA